MKLKEVAAAVEAVPSAVEDAALAKCVAVFEDALSDNLNTARAVSALVRLVIAVEEELRTGALSSTRASAVLSAVVAMDQVLGVLYEVPKAHFSIPEAAAETIPEEVTALARKRSALKAARQFEEADEIRRSLARAGFAVRDLQDGRFEVLRVDPSLQAGLGNGK